jgi:hypothetical protein
MSATTDTPLGGFEQRLLAQLRAEVAARPPELIQTTPAPSTPVRPSPRSSRGGLSTRRVPGRRLPAVASAAAAALVVAVLSVLPAASPSLAQAFPILTERTHVLPARLARALRSQWLASAEPRFDLRHAYAFTTPAGTGYVVVDQRARWLCILVPGLSAGSASGRCERVALARFGDPALSLRITGGAHRQEIVALLPRSASVSGTRSEGHSRQLELNHGVLAIVSRGPVTVTTKVNGRSSSTDYTP